MKILNMFFLNILFFFTSLFPRVELPFGVSFLKKSPKNSIVYGAAYQDYSGQMVIKENALFQCNGTELQSIVPEIVTINITNILQPNPLFDQGIRALAFIAPEQKDLPVVLSKADLKKIYAFENVETGSLLVSEVLKDSQGNDTSLLEVLAASIDGTIFTVAHPNQGLFGQAGTGIAVLVRGYVDINGKPQRIFNQIDLNQIGNPSAFPFDLSSAAFVFNNRQALSFQNSVLCWDDSLQCLYVGITGTGSIDPDGGIKGIAVFSIIGGTPLLVSLINEQALVGKDDLLLSKEGSLASVSVSKVEIMHTSTGLSYLIAVVGFEDQKEVRVLPLVESNGQDHGTVASKTSSISTLYLTSLRHSFFQKRIFDQPALTPSDLFEKTDQPALIGANETLSTLLYEHMNDCFVQGDSIFITVNNSDSPEHSGLFFSRALFGSDGRIIAWTRWQKADTTKNLFYAVSDLKQGGFYMATGVDLSHVNSISKSDWKLGSESSYAYLQDLFKDDLLSQGADISCAKILFEPHRVDNSILFIGGSYKKLLITILGTIDENGFVVNESTNTSVKTLITQNTTSLVPGTNTLVFSDPVLQSVGFITDCAYAYRQSPDQEFLVVSGSGGAVLLAQADFSGWQSDLGVGNNFSNIVLPVQWVMLENQEYIKKVIADNQYLYLVSDARITRINLNESDLANQSIDKVVIADINQFENTQAFIDFIPSQSHAILATTKGLYYSDLNSSVQTDSLDGIVWHNVTLPESVSSIEHIQVVTQSGNPVDMTQSQGSQIIMSATSQSNKRGTIIRATVDQDGTVTCFNDVRIRGAQSHFIDYGSFIKSSYSDGAFWYGLIKSGSEKLRTCLVGSVSLQPSTQFLGLMPSYVTFFNQFDLFVPRSIVPLPTGGLMITSNKEFAITQ